MLNFQALAAGTLLYVCVFEILEREKSKEHVPGLLQLLFVILGFTTLLLVTILSKEMLHYYIIFLNLGSLRPENIRTYMYNLFKFQFPNIMARKRTKTRTMFPTA